MITQNQPVTITIPATIDAALTPNRMPRTSAGHKKRDRLFRELKATTMWAVKEHYLDVFPFAPWRLEYVVAWGRSRKRMDDDNLKASLKAVQDGIADEVGLDDKHIEVGRVKQIRDPLGIGYIEVTIRSVEGEATS